MVGVYDDWTIHRISCIHGEFVVLGKKNGQRRKKMVVLVACCCKCDWTGPGGTHVHLNKCLLAGRARSKYVQCRTHVERSNHDDHQHNNVWES